MTTPTPAALDALADRSGGYFAAAATEYDIAKQWEGLGDRQCDELAAYHRTVAVKLLKRISERHSAKAS